MSTVKISLIFHFGLEGGGRGGFISADPTSADTFYLRLRSYFKSKIFEHKCSVREFMLSFQIPRFTNSLNKIKVENGTLFKFFPII